MRCNVFIHKGKDPDMVRAIGHWDPFQTKTYVPAAKIGGWISFIQAHFTGKEGKAR